ncbi:allantoate amidohydrolase [Arthrobacter sp. NPDC080073]|uniref:allantoate amidohydrolase n=1 Tax=Arthrobacter sp. NPDC080073 TaxID=3155919 RepID=UPI00344316C2
METVNQLLDSIKDVGRDAVRGGYSRAVYSTPELDLRQWFIEQAQRRGLGVETDRNGIIWAWRGKPQDGALVTGSHLDSVPGGGAFDGPLGVASALAAVDILTSRGLERARSLAITVFPEEEGSRFGVACLGSRLLTGAIDVDKALNLRDVDGNTFADVARSNGLDPRHVGPDPETMARIGDFVELHVEQGKGLGQGGPAIAVGSSILGHGRWKLSVSGQGNHAGTTLMADRADPMVAAAQIVVAVRDTAAKQPDARATVGRLTPVPGGTNVIASRVDLWLDARHPDDAVTAQLIEWIYTAAREIAASEGCTVSLTEESYSDTVHFDSALSRRIGELLPGAPVLATGAGHDAGVLAGHVPSAMLFVRNPSGISHSPEEYVADEDASAGAAALADVLEGLL